MACDIADCRGRYSIRSNAKINLVADTFEELDKHIKRAGKLKAGILCPRLGAE